MRSKRCRAAFIRVLFLSLLLVVAGGLCGLQAALTLGGGDLSLEGVGVDGVAEKKEPGLSEIIEAYERGDFKLAAKRALAQAGAGSAGAQFMMGLMHEQGKGMARRVDDAARWYERSAEQGNVAAKLNLGLISFRKIDGGVEGGDINEAKKWFESADADGDAKSAFYLGEIHRRGLDGNKDETRAFAYYQKAAGRGLPAGCNLAGIALVEGNGTEKDTTRAFEYFMKGANGDHVDAMYNVALSYQFGLGVEKKRPEAAAWFLRAARAGYVPAFVEIGRRYVEGDGILKDETAGAAWLHRASVSGEPTAQLLLAQLYLNGVGVEKDLRSALNHFAHSSNRGNMEARFALAQMLAGGLGTEDGKPDFGEAHGLAQSAGDSLEKAKEFALKLAGNLSDEDRQASRELLKKLKASDAKRSGAEP